MKRVLIKPVSVKVANIGAQIESAGYEIADKISEGTLSIEEGEVSTEERKAADGSLLYAVPSKDPISITMNIADFGEEAMANIFNRTLVSKTINGVECQVYEAKSAITSIYKQLALWFQSDKSYIWYPNLQTFDAVSFANIESEEGKNIITAKAYPDASGNVYYIVYPIEDVSFSTVASANVTAAAADVTYTLALKSGVTVTENGAVYSTTPNPTTGSTKKTVSTNTAGTKTASLTSLAASTKYYARPYAISGGVTTYGTEISFTTSAS